VKIRRALLVQHLQKISCNGQVTEAVFSEGFATRAMTPDHLLAVLAPTLPEVEPLEEEIGIADLATVIKSFGFIGGEGNESVDVNVRVENHRLVIDEEHRGVLRLMTASPKTIGTRIEKKTEAKLQAALPTGDGIALTRALIEGIQRTYTGFKAAEAELFVGPEGGRIQVGNANGHYAEFPSEDFTADQEYSLLFGEHLVDVLSGVTDFSSAVLRLGGPGKMILIQDGEYQYALSPRSRSADEDTKNKKKTKDQ
jgi:hypothetical protein